MQRLTIASATALLLSALTVPCLGTECDSARPEWLLCEDFETGAGDWDTWWVSTDYPGSGITAPLSGDPASRVRRAGPATRPLRMSRRPTGSRTP